MKTMAILLTVFALILMVIPSCVMTERIEIAISWNPSLYANISGPTVKVCLVTDKGGSHGSGVIIARSGDTYYVLTCYHVVDDSSASCYIVHPKIKDNDFAKVRFVDKKHDLAIVSFTCKQDLPVVGFASRAPEVTEPVYLFGYPGWQGPAVATMGIVSAKEGVWSDLPCAWIVTAQVWFGNSGGGCFNLRGELVGIAARIRWGNSQYLAWQCGIIPLSAIRGFVLQTKVTQCETQDKSEVEK